MNIQAIKGAALSIFLTIASCFSVQSFALDCRSTFLNTLKANDPEGYQIWNSLKPESKSQLEHFIVCQADRNITGTSANTLVHESLHFADSERSSQIGKTAYLLTTGNWITFEEDADALLYENSRGQALKVMSPEERKIERSKTYLYEYGYESFGVLLDELNAYTIGLRTSLRFPKILGSNERDGPLELMVFSIRYLEAVKKQSPDYYRRIANNTDLMNVVRALFVNAYSMYNQSCERTDLNMNDMRSIQSLQTESSREILSSLFGNQPPVISARCIETAKLNDSGEVTPLDYPHAPKKASSNESFKSQVEIPRRDCDPSKPCTTLYVERKSDAEVKMWADVKNNHIEWTVTFNAFTITWNGKEMTEEETERLVRADSELSALFENMRTQEAKEHP